MATNLPPSQLSAGRERVRIKPWSQLTDQTAAVKHRSLPREVVPNPSTAAEDGEPSEEDLEHKAEAVEVEEEDSEHEARSVLVKVEVVKNDTSQDVTEDLEPGGEQYFLDELLIDSYKKDPKVIDSDAKDLKESDFEYTEDREGIGTSKDL